MGRLKHAPRGSLHITGRKGEAPQFYLFDKEKTQQGKEPECGVYVGRKPNIQVKELAQKDYDEKMIKWIKKTQRKIQDVLNCYEQGGAELIYNRLSDVRKELVNPIEPTIEQFLDEWKSSKIQNANTYAITTNIYTENNELVRSKSEKIIADKYYFNNVPYIYEPQLVLKDGTKMFPDFCVLNLRTRKEYYHEHFGMMGDFDYCKRALTKISKYASNGIFIGDQLICTFETSDRPLDSAMLNVLIEKYLK